MSEEDNAANESRNSMPLAEHPEDSTTLINISQRTEDPSSGEPIATQSDVRNQTESTRVRRLRAKWEKIGKKTYAEIATQLPGGSLEGYGNASQVRNTTHILENNQQGPSNQDFLRQESHSLAPVEHVYRVHPLQLQESHLEESAVQGHSSQVCQLLSLHCGIKEWFNSTLLLSTPGHP